MILKIVTLVSRKQLKEKQMENIFLFNTFENGWNINDLQDIDAQEAYCVFTLEIPDEKIYGTEILDCGLEVILTDIEISELNKDWYINLNRICSISISTHIGYVA